MEISESVIRLGLRGDWVFCSVFCNFHGFFGGFVIYISPVTMGLMAFNRYMRICKSEQQYKRIFSPWKSRGLLACVWIFVACYTAAPKLLGLQDFVFVPGYDRCGPAHLSEFWKNVSLCLCSHMFPVNPLLTAIFSYIKIAKTIQQHNADASTTIQRRETLSHITTREIKISKSLFAVVLAFMICWIPFWVIVIL